MMSNKLKGTLCVNPERGRRRHIPQIEWKCPPKLTLDSNWYVAAGEESTEAVTQRRRATDPRPYAALREASDDSRTPIIPIIPIEEECNLINNTSAAFPTTAAMDGETMSLAIAAVNALNACASRQGEPPIDMASFIQWLNNSDTVRKYISGQSFPEIEPESMLNKPTHSVPIVSANPDQLNCVRANTGVVIPKPDAWTSSVPIQDVIDMDLLARLLQNPRDIEKLIKALDSSDRSGNQSASASMAMKAAADRKSHTIATTPESSLSFPKANTVPVQNSPSIVGASSASRKIFSPVVSVSLPQTQLSELPRASLQPTTNRLPSLQHRYPPLPKMHPHPVLGLTAPTPMPRTQLVTSMGPDPFLRTDLVTLQKANQQPAANMIHLPSASGHSIPLTNPSSLCGNSQVVGQGPPTLKPPRKPCMYFNTPKGCRNGASCRYLHSKSD